MQGSAVIGGDWQAYLCVQDAARFLARDREVDVLCRSNGGLAQDGIAIFPSARSEAHVNEVAAVAHAQRVAELVYLALLLVPATVLSDFLKEDDVWALGCQDIRNAQWVISPVQAPNALVYVPGDDANI
jgi:hypothetical protein